jgi:N-acetylmuramate 1-kinase
MPNSTRDQELALWVNQTLAHTTSTIVLTPLGGDAGFRRYFRLSSSQPLLAVDAPPQTEDSAQFIAIAQLLRTQGLKVPKVAALNLERGFLLVEDLGDKQLYQQVLAGDATAHYQQALSSLIQLQQCPDQPALIPRYDRTLLRRELEIFNDWFVAALLGYHLSAAETQLLDGCFHQLEDAALTQPQVLVHRDYHSRNLMLCAKGDLGLIDFQGALWGPITYDLASLLRDCYLRWPRTQVTDWAHAYRQQAIAAGLLPATLCATEFMRWLDWIGLQRHIKVLGIFARLQLRDGKHGYLKDLPLVIRYCLEVAAQYPELAAFVEFFNAKLLPLAQTHSWYSDYRHAGERS